MATKYWTGGAGTEVWATAGNYAGGVAPVSGDTVILDKNSLRGISVFPAWSSVTIAKLVATPGFRFKLGAVGNPFNPDVACTEFIWEATGDESEAFIDTKVDRMRIDSPVKGGLGVTWLDSGSIGSALQCVVNRGLLNLATSVIFNNASIVMVTHPDGRIVIPNGVTMGTGNKLVINGGTVQSAEDLVGVEILSGLLRLQDAAVVAALSLHGDSAIAKLEGTGTITTAGVWAGLLDAQENDIARTITNLYGSSRGRAMLGHSTTLTNPAIGIVPQFPAGVGMNKA